MARRKKGGLAGLEKAIEKMSKRAKSLKPVKGIFDRILSERLEATPIGEKERLWPSLRRTRHPEHFFAFYGTRTVRHGTTVPYAAAHDKWRKDNGLPSFLEVSPETMREMGRRASRWILTGDRKAPKTFAKSKTGRKLARAQKRTLRKLGVRKRRAVRKAQKVSKKVVKKMATMKRKTMKKLSKRRRK